jgi:hypothetical protein
MEQRAAEDAAVAGTDDDRPSEADLAADTALELGGVPVVRMVGVTLEPKQRPTVARILAEGEGPCQIAALEDHVMVLDGDRIEWMVAEDGTAIQREAPF